jgi:hypothetical protein
MEQKEWVSNAVPILHRVIDYIAGASLHHDVVAITIIDFLGILHHPVFI